MGKTKAACHQNAVGVSPSQLSPDRSLKASRVINTFKSMVVDDDVLEKEDMYILDRVKEFISSDEVNKFAAAKQLLILIERAVRTARGCQRIITYLTF